MLPVKLPILLNTHAMQGISFYSNIAFTYFFLCPLYLAFPKVSGFLNVPLPKFHYKCDPGFNVYSTRDMSCVCFRNTHD